MPTFEVIRVVHTPSNIRLITNPFNLKLHDQGKDRSFGSAIVGTLLSGPDPEEGLQGTPEILRRWIAPTPTNKQHMGRNLPIQALVPGLRE